MHVSRVVYELKRNLGDYNSQGITVEVCSTIDDNATGEAMLAEAKRIVHTASASTPALPQQKQVSAPAASPSRQPAQSQSTSTRFVKYNDPKDGEIFISNVEVPKEYWTLKKKGDWKEGYNFLQGLVPELRGKKTLTPKGSDGKYYIGYKEQGAKPQAPRQEELPVSSEDDFDDIAF